MFTFKIKIAKKTVEINALFESTKRFCIDFIVPDSHLSDISVVMTRQYIDEERALNAAGALNPDMFSETYLEILALYRKIVDKLADFGIVMFHGSALALDGEAYIFTAKSGTGKSTHTRLWRERFGERVTMINDDKPLISFCDEVAYVHGTPWNGKHRIGANISAPIKAICILERDAQNHIETVSKYDAFPAIFAQTYRPKNPAILTKIMPLIDKLTSAVRVYRLGCNMDIDAADVAFCGMKN